MSVRSRSRGAVQIWRARNARTVGDRAFTIYAILMIGIVAVAPVVRAVWLRTTSEAGLAILASPAAPGWTAFVVAALWAGALLLGRDRGPALLPPFLTYALATSDLSRAATLRAPLLRALAVVTAATMCIAGLVGGSLTSHGMADPVSTAVFVLAGALIGVIATVAWLAGQVFPRAAVPIALAVVAFAGLTAVVPVLQTFTPWGWTALAYPGTGSADVHDWLASLAVLATALAAVTPMLMNRLGIADLSAQAARWERATIHAAGLDFSAAATLYQGRPRVGRRIRAIRPARLTVTFLIRDAVGAARTPGRLIAGVLGFASAGALIALAFAPAGANWLLGAAAGLLVFAGLGPLTAGLRHAANVAADFPLYGISDERLLVNHALFPLAVVLTTLLAGAGLASIIAGVGVTAPILSSLALGILGLLVRLNNALKGSLPAVLLTPISTPMGDFSAAVRMAWALDGVLFAAVAGASAVLAFTHPILLAGVGVVLLAVGSSRWHHRAG